jgi:hypothetical protein
MATGKNWLSVMSGIQRSVQHDSTPDAVCSRVRQQIRRANAMRVYPPPTRSSKLLLCFFFASAVAAIAGQGGLPVSNDRAVHYQGNIRDQSIGTPIGAARIRLIPSDGQVWRSDSKGHFSFWAKNLNIEKLEVEADGYKSVRVAPNDTILNDVRLPPLVGDRSATFSPMASGATTRLSPPSQAVAPAIITADSAPRVSGDGEHWSRWYQLGVTRAPTGYTVQHVEFWLSGDRTCGSFADCREITRTDQGVSWEFRLQGHLESGAPRKTYSVAHIRVVYRAL